MRNMRFLKLYLSSQSEQAGLEVSFGDRPLLVHAPNNHGKSAILKSLYEVFGAAPHKIDDSWKNANVISLLKFTVDDAEYAALKTRGTYSFFDADGKLILSTTKISDEVAPFLANLLNFKLVMIDKQDQIRIPPPAYIFAPFYADQDRSWTNAWTSFSRMYLPHSPQTLAEYHSGLKPNEYYEAIAERDRLKAQIEAAEIERKAIHDAAEKIRKAASEITLSYDMSDFNSETQRLVSESRLLHEAQVMHREKLALLNEEQQLWHDQRDILNGAIAEMDHTLSVASSQPHHVECPTCGQIYENSLREQFGLVEDYDSLLNSRINAANRINEIDRKLGEHRADLVEIEGSLSRINAVFAVRKSELTFKDVVAAEGRTEANRLLQARLAEIDAAVGVSVGQMNTQIEKAKQTESRERSQRIKDEFAKLFSGFATRLEVRIEDEKSFSIYGVKTGRGSEGPRALLAYYFAFLRIARNYSSSVFCPIVIDAPNQQGQDKVHMPAMMRLMVDEAPKGSQLIIAAEDHFELTDKDIQSIDVTGQKDHVLRQSEFAPVSDVMRPYLSRLS